MFRVRFNLHGIEDTIDRVIEKQVLDDIKLNLFNMKNHVEYYFKENDKIHKKKDSGGELKGYTGIHDEYFEMVSTEYTEDEHDRFMLHYYPDSYDIYQDKEIDTKLTTLSHRVKFSFNITYFTKSRSNVISKINNLRLKRTMGESVFKHSLEYGYLIPNIVVELLSEINTLKNKRLDEQLTLAEYINKHFDIRHDYLNTLNGNVEYSSLVIREAQIETNGITATNLYEIEYEDDTTSSGYYKINLEYYILYEKPIAIIAAYPILIFNNLIDKRFIIRRNILEETHNTKSTEGLHNLIDKNVDKINKYKKLNIGKNYLTLPCEDLCFDTVWDKKFLPLFTSLIILDINNPRLLFNINDIDKISLTEILKEFIMKSDREYITEKFRSFFNFRLLVGNKPKNSYIKLTLKENGDLISNEDLDMKSTYRVCFSLLSDLDMLYYEDKKRIDGFINKEGFYGVLELIIKIFDTSGNTDNVYVNSVDALTVHLKSLRSWLPAKTVNIYGLEAWCYPK